MSAHVLFELIKRVEEKRCNTKPVECFTSFSQRV